jgi:hypothetical protein
MLLHVWLLLIGFAAAAPCPLVQAGLDVTVSLCFKHSMQCHCCGPVRVVIVIK